MNKYEEFVKLFVKHQFDYFDFSVDTYDEYVQKQKNYYEEHINPKFQDFESWFDAWGLSEDEFHFVVEMILEMGGYF